MTHYIPENNVYIYFRYNNPSDSELTKQNESVMVVINNSNETQTFKTNRFAESIQDYQTGNDILSGKSIDLKNEISIEGKSVLVLELK